MEPLPEIELGSWALLTGWDLELAGHISSGHVTQAMQARLELSAVTGLWQDQLG